MAFNFEKIIQGQADFLVQSVTSDYKVCLERTSPLRILLHL